MPPLSAGWHRRGPSLVTRAQRVRRNSKRRRVRWPLLLSLVLLSEAAMLCSGTRQTRVVFLLFLVTDVLLSVDSGALPVALPSLTAQFHLSRFGQGSLGALTPAGFAVATTMVGLLLQRHSPRALLVAGLAVTAVCSATFSGSPNAALLFLSRAGYGLAYAVFFVFVPVWITIFAPEDRATSWISVMQAGAPVGAVIGMACGGVIANAEISWRFTFLAQSLAIAMCMIAFSAVPVRLIDGAGHVSNVRSPSSASHENPGSPFRNIDLATTTFANRSTAASPGSTFATDRTTGPSISLSPNISSQPRLSEDSTVLSQSRRMDRSHIMEASLRTSIMTSSSRVPHSPCYQTCSPSVQEHGENQHPSAERLSTEQKDAHSMHASLPLEGNGVLSPNGGSFSRGQPYVMDVAASSSDFPPPNPRFPSNGSSCLNSHHRYGPEEEDVSVGAMSASRRLWNDTDSLHMRERPLYRHLAGQSLALEPEALAVVLKPTLWQQISLLWGNRVYVNASLALGFLTFTVEGIRYWVVIYRTEVFNDDLGTVVAAFTLVSCTAPILGMFMGGGIIDRCGGYRNKEGVARSMRILMYFSLFAGPSAALMLLGDLGTTSSLKFFAISTWMLLFFGGAHVAPLTGIMIGVVPAQMRPLSSAVSLLVNHIVGFFFAPFGVGIISNLRGIKLGFQTVIAMSAVAIMFGFLGWLAAEKELLLSKSQKEDGRHTAVGNSEAADDDMELNDTSLLPA